MPTNAAAGRRYALVTPCRDEVEFAARCLDSVVKQTIPPTIWVIVDDGSTDGTTELLTKYVDKFDYIRVVRRDDRGARSVGPGVIDAFYAGYDTLEIGDYDYVCKFDLDLDIPPTYFEEQIRRMEADARVGSCSGKPYFGDPATGKLVSEKVGDETSVGMAKFFRVPCFLAIGGFVREVMWDGIDAHRCRMLGWKSVSIDDPSIRFTHLRPMGTSDVGMLVGRARWGFGQYFMGTGWLWILASCLYRMTRPPLFVGGLAILWGYTKSFVTRVPRYEDREFRRFLRRYHRRCLFLGKAEATRRTDLEQHPVWERVYGSTGSAAHSAIVSRDRATTST